MPKSGSVQSTGASARVRVTARDESQRVPSTPKNSLKQGIWSSHFFIYAGDGRSGPRALIWEGASPMVQNAPASIVSSNPIILLSDVTGKTIKSYSRGLDDTLNSHFFRELSQVVRRTPWDTPVLRCKIPWPFFSRKPPALTLINRR